MTRERAVGAAIVLVAVLVSGAGWAIAQFRLPPASELVEVTGEIGDADGARAGRGGDGGDVVPGGGQSPATDDLFPPGSGLPDWLREDLEKLEDLLLPLPGSGSEEGATDGEFFEPFAEYEYVTEPVYLLPSARSLGIPGALPLASALTIPVTGFTFEGNTAFSDSELATVVESFLAKGNLTSDDLQSARLALTEHYINGGKRVDRDVASGDRDPEAADGYVSSGAVLPDQNPLENGGVVEFKIVEGELTRIDIVWSKTDPEGEPLRARRTLTDRYLKPRIERGAGKPLHMGDIRDQLQRLQRNPNIGRINAELKPDSEPGKSYLDVKVDPAQMSRAGIDFHNERSPSVGAEQIELWLEHTSLTRRSDRLGLRYGLLGNGIDGGEFGGGTDYSVQYSLPVSVRDTLLDFAYSKAGYAVIEEPFVALGIEGRTRSWRVGLRHPLIDTDTDRLTLGLHLEKHHSETELLGIPFSLTPGAVDGEIDVAALRFSQEWSHRDSDYVVALRSIFSIGLDTLGSTRNAGDRDARFLSWLGQGQYIRRLDVPWFDDGVQAVARGNLQLTNSPLPAPEQYSIGGAHSVRGYRENQLVRDMGYQGSLELKLPLPSGKRGRRLTVVPFIDVGGGWNHVDGGMDNAHETIVSAGVGIQASFLDRLNASVFWGHRFADFGALADGDLQDSGVHFRVSCLAW